MHTHLLQKLDAMAAGCELQNSNGLAEIGVAASS